ncbi:MAG TPA: GspMb/PilO family protein [Thermoanaerobaculia bacterium]|nr:GspMb/PilO family protein [Thermoanaerobaculia bacterium]
MTVWREKRLLLGILGVLLAASTLFFFTYRVQYEKRLQDLDTRRDQVRLQLEEVRRARLAAEQQVAAYRKIERDVRWIFDERWSTQAQRLTRMITEVNRLAIAANLVPPSRSYTRTEPQRGRAETGVGATQVAINFTVKGSYQQIRRLINMLELSEHFIIIDRIDLNATEGETLTMNLQVKTLFRDTSAPAPRVPNQQL